MKKMSPTRKRYMASFVGRCVILLLVLIACFVRPNVFGVMEGWKFFTSFSPLHLLWALWMFDMIKQLLPIDSRLALGSKKWFVYKRAGNSPAFEMVALQQYIRRISRRVLGIFLLWWGLIAVVGALYFLGIIGQTVLFVLTAVFYVCDLICVLFWCPFRLMQKIKCCTTCRIFNWDHMMMFSPLIFIPGVYTWSLVAMSFVTMIVWEVAVWRHPERFWEISNEALKCAQCTDKLCTQYCEKKRREKP